MHRLSYSRMILPKSVLATLLGLAFACGPQSVPESDEGSHNGSSGGAKASAPKTGGGGTAAVNSAPALNGQPAAVPAGTGGRPGIGSGGSTAVGPKADGGVGSPAVLPPGMVPDGGITLLPPNPANAAPFTGGMRVSTALADRASPVFDDSQILTYELVLEKAEWDKLQSNPRAEVFVKAKLIFMGQEFYPIGMRYKGAYTLEFCIKNNCRKSIKLDFAEFNDKLRFFGLKRINFHVMFNDDSFLRDRLAYSTLREFGLPASRMAHARLIVQGKSSGIYAAIEAVDGDFVKARFEDNDGNVYKEAWPGSSDTAFYKKQLKTNRDNVPPPSVDRMVRFGQAIKAATDSTAFDNVMKTWTDPDQFMKTVAIDRALGNWDGPIVAWYCFGGKCANHNFYFYEESKRDKLWLTLWDMNDTFKPFMHTNIKAEGMPEWSDATKGCGAEIRILGGSTPAKPATCDDFIRKVGASAMLKAKYVEQLKKLQADLFTPAKLQSKIDLWAKQLMPVVAEEEKAGTHKVQTWMNEVTNLRNNYIPTMLKDLDARIKEMR